MSVVIKWRIVHHKAMKGGKLSDAKTVIFAEHVDGIHMSTRQIDFELWEPMRSKLPEAAEFVQEPDLLYKPVEKPASLGIRPKKTRRRRPRN